MSLRFRVALAVIAAVVLLFAGAVYYLFFTTSGLTFAASVVCARLPPNTVTVSRIEGNLVSGAVFRDVEASEIGRFPGAVIRAQEVRVSFPGHWNVSVRNGRLDLPTGEVISFSGKMEAGTLDCNVYSGLVYSQSFFRLIGVTSVPFSGRMSGMDLYLSGPLEAIKVRGAVRLDDIRFRNFNAKHFPLRLDLTVKLALTRTGSFAGGRARLFGRITADHGIFSSRYADMEVRRASCDFSGDPAQPVFKAHGATTIAGTRIRAVFSGTPSRPELQLTSQPPMPQDRLLVMLVTGKSWKGTAGALTEGRVTPGLIKDFADFFILGGSVENLQKKLGITDIEMRYQRGEKSFEVHKSITPSTGVIYGIARNEGTHSQSGEPEQVRTVGLEYRFNGALSLEGRRQLREKPTGLSLEPERENVIRLKFKKAF